jgi:spore coat polysaccharide biosynthesis protein SpsF
MRTVAIIQARMGSTRLPGKVMLPLDGTHLLIHDIKRTMAAETVDDVVVATSTKTADDIVARYARRTGATVYRGSESDVLGRMYQAAEQEHADAVVRITGDCPLIAPDVINGVVEQLIETDADYSTNIIERTFPRGLDVEAFSFNSFQTVYDEATDQHHREHVTPYYHERDDLFHCTSITSKDVFDSPQMQDRTDIRITIDEADDYELLKRIYEDLDWSEWLDIRDVVDYIDANDLTNINQNVEQKTYDNT